MHQKNKTRLNLNVNNNGPKKINYSKKMYVRY